MTDPHTDDLALRVSLVLSQNADPALLREDEVEQIAGCIRALHDADALLDPEATSRVLGRPRPQIAFPVEASRTGSPRFVLHVTAEGSVEVHELEPQFVTAWPIAAVPGMLLGAILTAWFFAQDIERLLLVGAAGFMAAMTAAMVVGSGATVFLWARRIASRWRPLHTMNSEVQAQAQSALLEATEASVKAIESRAARNHGLRTRLGLLRPAALAERLQGEGDT